MVKLQSFKTKLKRLKFMKTAFVCDSALQINKNFANNNPITVIPVEVRLDDEIFEDNVTITPDEF